MQNCCDKKKHWPRCRTTSHGSTNEGETSHPRVTGKSLSNTQVFHKKNNCVYGFLVLQLQQCVGLNKRILFNWPKRSTNCQRRLTLVPAQQLRMTLLASISQHETSFWHLELVSCWFCWMGSRPLQESQKVDETFHGLVQILFVLIHLYGDLLLSITDNPHMYINVLMMKETNVLFVVEDSWNIFTVKSQNNFSWHPKAIK